MNVFAARILSSLGSAFTPILRQALGGALGGLLTHGVQNLGDLAQGGIKSIITGDKNQFKGTLDDFKKNMRTITNQAALSATGALASNLKRTSDKAIGQLTSQLTKRVFK